MLLIEWDTTAFVALVAGYIHSLQVALNDKISRDTVI